MFQIERDVPLTQAKRAKGGAPSVYPFHQMSVGDSFFVPSAVQRAKIVRNAADWHAKRYGTQFRVLIVEGGSRCWRVG